MSSRAASTRSFLWAGAYAAVCSLALLVPLAWPGRNVALLLASVAGVALGLYPFQRSLRRGELDFFEPVLFCTLVSFPILLRPLYWLAAGEVELAGYSLEPERALQAALLATTYLYLGHAVYYWSYYRAGEQARTPPFLPRFAAPWQGKRVAVVLLLYTLTGAACYWLLMEEVGGLSHFLSQLYQRRRLTSELGPLYVGILLLSAALLIWFLFQVRKPAGLLLWAPFAGAVLLVLATLGGRVAVVVPVLLCIICWHYLVQRLSFWKLVLCAAVLITFAVAYVQLRMSTLTEGEVRLSLLAEREWAPSDVLEHYFVDQNYLDTFAVLVHDMPRTLPFQYGKTWLNLLVWPIPRKLWPEKPPAFEGSVIGQTYFGGWGRPAGYAGALYMNFHVPGIVAGYFLLGAFHRALYAWLRAHPRHPGVVGLYAVSVVFLVGLSNLAISQWVVYALPLWLAFRFVGVPERRRARARSAASWRAPGERAVSRSDYA